MIFHKKILFLTSLLALLTIIITGVYTSSADETLTTPVPYITTGTKCGGTMTVRKNFPPDPNATSFVIYRASGQVNSGSEFQEIATVPAVDGSFVYTDTGLTPSYMYRYKLMSRNSTSTSAQSNYASAISSAECAIITPPTVYPIPSSPTLEAKKISGSCYINLSWNGVSGVQTYNLYKQKSGGTITKLTSLSSSNTSYTDKSVSVSDAGTSIQYSIVASNSTGSSATSSMASITPDNNCDNSIVPVEQTPIAPSTFSALPSGSCGYKVSLSWLRGQNATGYKIFRSENSNGTGYVQISGSPLTTSSQTPTFTDNLENLSGVSNAKSYFYRIYSTNSTGDSTSYTSANSRPSSICSPSSLLTPVAPTVNTASKCGGKVTLTWPRVTNDGQTALSHDLYRSTSPNGSFTKVGSGYGGYTDTGNPSTIYYYKIKTVDGTAESAESNVSSGKSSVSCTNTPAGPTAPTALKVTTSLSCGGKVDLSWTPSTTPGVTYKIRRSKFPSASFTVIATNVSGTTYTDTAPNLDTKYYYIVSALNSNNQESPSTPSTSANSSLVCPVTPPVPENLKAYPSDLCGGKIRLIWNKSTGAKGYNVYRSNDGTNFTKIANNYVGIDYTDTTGSADITYSYKVTAVDTNLESDASNVSTSKGSALCLPQLPAPVLSSTVSNIPKLCTAEVRINWVAISGAIGYNIYRSVDNINYELIDNTGTTTTSSVDTYFENGGSYSYKVAAIGTDREGLLSNPVTINIPQEYIDCNPNRLLDAGIHDPSITPSNIRKAFGDDNANGICEQGEGCYQEWSGIGDDNANGVCDPGEMCYPDEIGTSTVVYDESGLSVDELIGPSTSPFSPVSFLLPNNTTGSSFGIFFDNPNSSDKGNYVPVVTGEINKEAYTHPTEISEGCILDRYKGGSPGSDSIIQGSTVPMNASTEIRNPDGSIYFGAPLILSPYEQFPSPNIISNPRKDNADCPDYWRRIVKNYLESTIFSDPVKNPAFGMLNDSSGKIEYEPLEQLESFVRNFDPDALSIYSSATNLSSNKSTNKKTSLQPGYVWSPSIRDSKAILTLQQADTLQFQYKSLQALVNLKLRVDFRYNTKPEDESQNGYTSLEIRNQRVILREVPVANLYNDPLFEDIDPSYKQSGIFISEPLKATVKGLAAPYPETCTGATTYESVGDIRNSFRLVVNTNRSTRDGEDIVSLYGPVSLGGSLFGYGPDCPYSDVGGNINNWWPATRWELSNEPVSVTNIIDHNHNPVPDYSYTSNNAPIPGTGTIMGKAISGLKLYFHTDSTEYIDDPNFEINTYYDYFSLTGAPEGNFNVIISSNDECYTSFGRFSPNCALLEPLFPIMDSPTTYDNFASQMIGAISEAFWNVIEAIKSIFKRD